MSGQLAAFKAAGLPAQDMSRYKNALKGAVQAAKQAASGALLVRLVKGGIWKYGPDNVEVQEGSEWVVNPFSLSMGYAAWGEEKTPLQGKLVDERMALITDPQIDLNALKDHDMAPWRPQVQFDALCLTGEDVGVLVRYKTTSVGGKRAFAGLMQEVSNQADGDGLIVPVITFQVDSYDNKTWGETFVPVFEIVEWKSPDDTTLGTAAEGDQQDAHESDEPDEPSSEETAPAASPKAQEPAQPTRRRAAVTDVEEEKPSRRAAANGAKAPAENPAPASRRAAAAPASKPERRAAATPAKEQPRQVDRGAVVRRRRR